MKFVYDTLAGEGLAGNLFTLLIASGVLYTLYKVTIGNVVSALESDMKAGALKNLYQDAIVRSQIVVAAVKQTYTDALKEGRADGKLTDEEKKAAFDMAKNMLLSQAWGEGTDFIKDNVSTLIEAAIGVIKGEKNVPLASSQPSTGWVPSPVQESASRQEALAPLPELS